MQKNDNLVNIVMSLIRELKNVIVSTSVAVFIIVEENAKGIDRIEEKSG